MAIDGSTYAPVSQKVNKTCEKGDFPISVAGLDHGHIYGMTENLLKAGANIELVWDRDPKKIEAFCKAFPEANAVSNEQEVYDCERTKMVLSSIIANERWEIGMKALSHGKHYMSDKTGFTRLEDLDAAKRKVKETGLKWSICFSERLQVESAILAGQLIDDGEIGDVVQVMTIAPHLLNAPSRPDWFFKKKQYGGILCDIGSHQIDQMLFYTGSAKGHIVHSQVGNFNTPDYPELEDFGDCTIQFDSGATGYTRLDWFTPAGLENWGDGRFFILGTKGYMEARKYINVGVDVQSDTLFLVNDKKKEVINAKGSTGYPYFAQLIRDCLEDTDKALPQEHLFEVSRLAVEAENKATWLNGFNLK